MDYNKPQNTEKDDTSKYPPIEKIEGANATVNKPSPWKKFMNSFFQRDIKSVSGEFVDTWLIPQLQYLVVDGVNSILESIFGIRGTIPGSSIKVISSKKTNYNAISTNKATAANRVSNKDIYEIPEIIVPDRATAEQALYRCREYLREYEAVPVDRLLDCLDISGDFVDTKYGWTNLDGAMVKHTRDGWVFVLPEPVFLGNK